MSTGRPTLVVVDDEVEVLHTVHDLFRIDYRVLTFERGADALRTLEREPEVHVVMTDQRMPTMTGVELLRRAKQVRPDATRLLFTGYADIKAVVDAINQGNVFRYITKPWDPDELQATVRQAVEQHDLVVERQRLLRELQEKNARLTEANRLKAAFIEVASHELNTPVSVVLGLTELWRIMQADRATLAERGWVERIQGAGQRLAHTVERMLQLLRADQLDHTLDLTPTMVELLLRQTIADLQPFLQARQQTVHVHIAPGLGTAEIDTSKISDVLTNLLINAIKFTPDGGKIDVTAGPSGDDRVVIRVADSGVGIGSEECGHLFEPFFTGYDTLHHSSGDYQFCKRGMGLGLCLVKTFVEMHGGTVDVRSTPGVGSTFEVRLPRCPSSSRTRRVLAPHGVEEASAVESGSVSAEE